MNLWNYLSFNKFLELFKLVFGGRNHKKTKHSTEKSIKMLKRSFYKQVREREKHIDAAFDSHNSFFTIDTVRHIIQLSLNSRLML